MFVALVLNTPRSVLAALIRTQRVKRRHALWGRRHSGTILTIIGGGAVFEDWSVQSVLISVRHMTSDYLELYKFLIFN
jgi:hypothetical protein